MKIRQLILCFTLLLMAFIISCKKDTDPNIASFKIVKETEKVVVGTTEATISGTFDYPGVINSIKVRIGTDAQLFGSDIFATEVSGKAYSVHISGLHSGTMYYYRYEVDYGAKDDFLTETDYFTTQSESPTVKTLEVLAMDSTTFRIKCEVIFGGGQEVTERGICYNIYGDPTLDDETLQHTSSGIGQYTVRMESLPTNTVYYVRAYAKNAAGTGFGEELTFRTGGATALPQVSTVEIGNVTYNTAQCLGNISSDGGLAVTERGVCWGLEPDPSINVHHAVAEGTGIGNFTVVMGGLSPNTTYHARCYAINEKGTAYGEELTFKTTEGLPMVTTGNITDITSTSAKGNGEVTDQGASPVTERGLCWSTNHEPTTSDNHESNGTGAGTYTVSMVNLTPNATYYVRAYAVNSQGVTYGAEVSFTAREGLPVVQTLDVSDVSATTANAHCKVTDQGGSPVTERGVCWGTEPSPTVTNSHTNNGTGAGEYEVSITGLTPGMTYYVRAYAQNTQGLTYGAEITFNTVATLPTVTTGNIDGTIVYGTVTDDGGSTVTERGVCWSTSHNPTTDGTHAASLGTGIGSFSVELTDLEPGTTYYVRAYATNGTGTAYGNEKTLRTDANLATVTTGEVSNVTQTSAQGSGTVTSDGGADVTERGVCWSTSHNPTVSDSHATNGTGLGGYMVNMNGLTPNKTYYVRAYAKNSAGIAYGDEVHFTTSQSISAPTVTTNPVVDITQTTATGGGTVTNDGGATVTERGICWSTNHNPTTSGSHASSGTGTGTFTVNMTGLTAGITYYVRAYAINSQGTSYGDERSFNTEVAVTLPIVTTSQVTNITQTSATGGGNVTSDGGATVTERGICWSTSHNPTTSGSHANNGTGMGIYTVNMTGLTANTTFYVRAYAINSAGTAYGAEVSFTTPQNVTLPTVTTSQVTNITQTSATGGGNVTSDGGATVTERGICWSTIHNPTTSGSHANNGTGIGSFTVNMTGLTAGTTYYVRAYAINSAGTAYGAEVNFTTPQNVTLPTVTTSQVTNITQTSATGGGNVTNDGNATVTERGVCWSTSHNPTTSGSHANNGMGTGSFTVNMTGLTANTTYYVRAYAINSAGTSYGNEVSFYTLPSGSNAPTGAIDGLFTINSSGTQVYFSQGNLQYKASSNTWQFASNQYDNIGNGNSNISQTNNGWIDLFGWGTSGWNSGAVCYQPWSTSTTDTDYYPGGSYTNSLTGTYANADWGVFNLISNGGTSGSWRTLTGGPDGEWYYVLHTRSASTVNGVANARFAKAKVANIKGVILFPDNYTHPTGIAQPIGVNSTGTTGWNGNNYSASDFALMQSAGAVFLPAAGYRSGTTVDDLDSWGYYWSSSYGDVNGAHGVFFYDTGFYMNSASNRSNGFSVRLVCPAQ